MITEAVKGKSTLTSLFLSGDEFFKNDWSKSTEGEERVRGKKKKKEWSDVGIRDETATGLSEVLRSNNALTELDLRCEEMKTNEQKRERGDILIMNSEWNWRSNNDQWSIEI